MTHWARLETLHPQRWFPIACICLFVLLSTKLHRLSTILVYKRKDFFFSNKISFRIHTIDYPLICAQCSEWWRLDRTSLLQKCIYDDSAPGSSSGFTKDIHFIQLIWLHHLYLNWIMFERVNYHFRVHDTLTEYFKVVPLINFNQWHYFLHFPCTCNISTGHTYIWRASIYCSCIVCMVSVWISFS